MTAQQARLVQAKRYEWEAVAHRTARRVLRRQFGKKITVKQSFIRFCERTARANRRAIRRNAS